jgi:hypothetical protein
MVETPPDRVAALPDQPSASDQVVALVASASRLAAALEQSAANDQAAADKAASEAVTGPALAGEPTAKTAPERQLAEEPTTKMAPEPQLAEEPLTEKASEPAPAEKPTAEVASEVKVLPPPPIQDVAAPAPSQEKDLPAAGKTSPPFLVNPEPLTAAGKNEAAYPNTGMPVVRPFVPEPAEAAKVAAQPAPREAGSKVAQRASQRGEPAWPAAEALLAQLDALSKHEATRPWATETARLIQDLGPAICKGAKETSSILARLDKLGGEASAQALTLRDRAAAPALLRTGYALQRRVSVWKQINAMGGLAAANDQAPPVDPRAMARCLGEIESLTRDSEEGKAWRRYLLLDALREWSGRRKSADERLPSDLSQQVLRRMNQSQMTAHQRQFVSSGPLASLHREVVRHASDPVDASRLLADLERYERTDLPNDGRRLAEDCQYLAASSSEAYRQLASRVEQHYRNANVRLALSEELLNLLVPKRAAEYAPVDDTVLGVPVRGQSFMASDVRLRLIPDPARVLLALEVTARVSSLTSATKGPATFINDSQAMYTARKPMAIDLRGIVLWPTEVDVDNDSRLRQVYTDFDPVPLFGPLARSVAEKKHNQNKPAADAEVREKIVARATERVDRETSAGLTEASRKLHQTVLGPIEALLLDPTLVAAETTEQRCVMRVRLAGHDQLGSHTPRPQAPADSLASAQIHESLLNNVIERLELDGQTFTLAELAQRIAERLHRGPPKPVDADQEDVKITFAAQNAVCVRCVEGRLEVTLSVAKLSKSPRRWKDFQVRVFYRPEIQGRSIELVRDGVVQLIGTSRLATGSQLALRGVFSKVFSQKSPWNVTPEAFVKNPKLAGLAFTQFAIGDGWIGVALGQPRTAVKPAALQR